MTKDERAHTSCQWDGAGYTDGFGTIRMVFRNRQKPRTWQRCTEASAETLRTRLTRGSRIAGFLFPGDKSFCAHPPRADSWVLRPAYFLRYQRVLTPRRVGPAPVLAGDLWWRRQCWNLGTMKCGLGVIHRLSLQTALPPLHSSRLRNSLCRPMLLWGWGRQSVGCPLQLTPSEAW